MTEDQRIVTKDIQEVDQQRYLHRIVRLVGCTKHGRNGETDGLKEAETTHNVHIGAGIGHQIRAYIHQEEHPLTKQEEA